MELWLKDERRNEIHFELIFAAMLSKKWKWMGSSLLIWIDFWQWNFIVIDQKTNKMLKNSGRRTFILFSCLNELAFNGWVAKILSGWFTRIVWLIIVSVLLLMKIVIYIESLFLNDVLHFWEGFWGKSRDVTEVRLKGKKRGYK